MDNLFGLEDKEFWSDPWKNLRGLSWGRISQQVSGIIIAMPSKVSLSKHRTLPLLIFRSGDTSQMSVDSFDKGANFIIENTETKEKIHCEYRDEKEKVKPSLVVKMSEGFSGREYELDLSSQGIKKLPGKYKARVKIKNISSNIVEFKITK